MMNRWQAIIRSNDEQVTSHYMKQWWTGDKPLYEAMMNRWQAIIWSNDEQVTSHYMKQWWTCDKPLSEAMMNRQKAIIWSNDGMIYWHIYVSVGLNELTTTYVWLPWKTTYLSSYPGYFWEPHWKSMGLPISQGNFFNRYATRICMGATSFPVSSWWKL